MVDRRIKALLPMLGFGLIAVSLHGTEMVAHLELSAPGTDWEVKGREAVLADVEVDGSVQQQLMLYAGARRHKYSVFLGDLAGTNHTVRVREGNRRAWRYAGAGGACSSAFAPVLFEMKNAIGMFTDIPLITYVEKLTENGQQILQYTVIFSNEDGGTSTRSLMARWGRTTDIEYVYRAYLKPGGTLDKAIIQSRGHKDIEFNGPFWCPSDADAGDRQQHGGRRRPERGTLSARAVSGRFVEGVAGGRHGREPDYVAGDDFGVGTGKQAAAVWRGAGGRPSRIRGTTSTSQAHVQPGKAAIAFVVLHKNGQYYYSHKGRTCDSIERSGWVRSTIELPPGTTAGDLKSINPLCVYWPKSPSDVSCGPTEIKSLFFLTRDKLPRSPFQLPLGNN